MTMPVIKDEAALSPDYKPKYIPHREHQLSVIDAYLRPYIRRPGEAYPRVILVGRSGTGKTVTINKYADRIDNPKVKYVRVDCFMNRTLVSALRSIASQLGIVVPRRGLSTDEIIEIIASRIKENDVYMVLVLDDVFNLVTKDGVQALATIIRLGNDRARLGAYRFALVVVLHNLGVLDQLDSSTRGILGRAIVEFPPYTKDQMYDILSYRAREALEDGSYTDDVLRMIADVAGVEEGEAAPPDRGDARMALDILWRAAKAAEMEGRNRIMPEHVRGAVKEVLVGIRPEEISALPLHERLFLLAIVRALKRADSPYVSFGAVESEYRVIADEFGEKPRSHTSLWEYLTDLRKRGIVETRPSGKGMRGRTTLISIPSEPLHPLEKELERSIRASL